MESGEQHAPPPTETAAGDKPATVSVTTKPVDNSAQQVNKKTEPVPDSSVLQNGQMQVRRVPPATVRDRIKAWFGLAIIPKVRWELKDPNQIDVSADVLTVRDSAGGNIILKVTAGKLKGAMLYPVQGRPNAFDLVVDVQEPNRFIPRESRAFYAGTFICNDAFQPAYQFLKSRGLASSPLLSHLFL
jgi:hypothetical protein